MAPHKLFYKGNEDDFIVFVDNADLLAKYRKGDKSIPLIDVVSNYKIYITRNGGSEGVLDQASNTELGNEFGKKSHDEIIEFILQNGSDKAGASARHINNSTNDFHVGPIR